MASNRREFLKRATGATAALAAGPALVGAGPAWAASAPPPGAPEPAGATAAVISALHPALEIEGSFAGFPSLAMGGEAYGVTVLKRLPGDSIGNKHLGTLMFEGIKMEIGLHMAPAAYEWINHAINGKWPRKSGAIIGVDLNNELVMRREFSQALMTEVRFPDLDASSTDAAHLEVIIQPEQTLFTEPSLAITGSAAATPKPWLVSNFRVDIGALPCSGVSKVEAFAIKMKAVDDVGGKRGYGASPGEIEIPNIVMRLPLSDAADWRAWHEDFVVHGNSGPGTEKAGTIKFLDMTRGTLGTLQLQNIGIVRLTEDPWDAKGTTPPGITVEMYVERMDLSVSVDP